MLRCGLCSIVIRPLSAPPRQCPGCHRALPVGPQPGQAMADSIVAIASAIGGEPSLTITALGAPAYPIDAPDGFQLINASPLCLQFVDKSRGPGGVAALAVLAGYGVWRGAHEIEDTATVVALLVFGGGFVAMLVYSLLLALLNRTTIAVRAGVLSVRTGPVPVYRGHQQVQLSDVTDVELWRRDEQLSRTSATTKFNVVVSSAVGEDLVLNDVGDEQRGKYIAQHLAQACARS